MKAVGYSKSLPITDIESLTDIELPQPVATGHDLLVKVRAVAVNPVDYKIRQNVSPGEGEQKVLGWDAVGEVVATGEVASQFTPGDVVYYADDLNRQGSNAENLRTAHEKLESGRSIGKIVLQGFHAD
jgi:NADPH:quinone reductase-like Zn-dependent oxidoreductase